MKYKKVSMGQGTGTGIKETVLREVRGSNHPNSVVYDIQDLTEFEQLLFVKSISLLLKARPERQASFLVTGKIYTHLNSQGFSVYRTPLEFIRASKKASAKC